MAITNKLTAIGDAIRNKTGSNNTMKLDEMVTEISNISVGSGSSSVDNKTYIVKETKR